MAKTLFTIIICLFCLTLYGQEGTKIIKFRSIGPSDKPFPTLLISIREIEKDSFHLEMPLSYTLGVETPTFLFIEQFIKTHKKIEERFFKSDLGSYLISVDTQEYTFLRRKEALTYFKKIKNSLENSKKLSKEDVKNLSEAIDAIIIRIDW